MAEKTRGIKIEQGAKRVRAYLTGEVVADTKTPFLVWEWPHYPTYYFPLDDVRAELVPAGRTQHSPSRGEGQVYHVKVAGADADGAALRYPDSPIETLRDLVRLDWNSMTEWFEEDEPVYVHPRDPYYVPLTDVRMDLLRPTDTQTRCPYKGIASYWSVDTGQAVHTDVVWIYRTPLPESQKVAGLACFYNEKVDITLDGERQERPRTHFS